MIREKGNRVQIHFFRRCTFSLYNGIILGMTNNYPHGNIDDFFLSYKELAHLGTVGARAFEEATCEMFRKIFHMRAEHVGPIGNTPDVFVESEELGYCGIIDNKAYNTKCVHYSNEMVKGVRTIQIKREKCTHFRKTCFCNY